MALNLQTFILGSIENNTYLIADSETGEAAVIDPAIPSRELLESIRKNGYDLKSIWITHAHFDHVGGVEWLRSQIKGNPNTVLHRGDLDLWQRGGGAGDFGFDFEAGGTPEMIIDEDQDLILGSLKVRVLHTPGHTPGHVTFSIPEGGMAFCGDLIFFHGVGRSDLPYSNGDDLIKSIREKILTLPDETVLYPGHGPSTTVAGEKESNPFII